MYEYSKLTIGDIAASIEKLRKPESFNIGGYEFPVIKSNVFPFHETFKACEVDTHEEIDILSGEMIHGALICGKIYCDDFYITLIKESFPLNPNTTKGIENSKGFQ